MTVGVKLREQIDDMKRTGRSPLDIAEFVGTLAIAWGKDDSVDTDDRIRHESEFNMPSRSSKQALCPKCDQTMIHTRNPRTNERLLMCSNCGHKTNPKIEPVQFATNISTVEGLRRRKMGSAKLSGTTSSGNQVALEQDEFNRDLYSDRSTITKKKVTITGDDKRISEGSGRSITDVQQINPT